MKKIIAIDIDNTVSDTVEVWMEFTEIALKELGKKPKRKPGVFSTTEAYGLERGSLLMEQIKKRIQQLNQTNIEDYKVIPYAKENICKLKADGYSIYFLSARSDKYFGNAKALTEKWLKINQIPYDMVICECEDKGIMCKKLGADILIDDGLQYCNMATEHGCKAIYFDDENKGLKQSGQNNNPNIHTCKNWNEIYNMIAKIYREH